MFSSLFQNIVAFTDWFFTLATGTLMFAVAMFILVLVWYALETIATGK
tara:strand:- start:403 stop:546 length:144 start_codon:yes stop_codon:yes gene_type:complete